MAGDAASAFRPSCQFIRESLPCRGTLHVYTLRVPPIGAVDCDWRPSVWRFPCRLKQMGKTLATEWPRYRGWVTPPLSPNLTTGVSYNNMTIYWLLNWFGQKIPPVADEALFQFVSVRLDGEKWYGEPHRHDDVLPSHNPRARPADTVPLPAGLQSGRHNDGPVFQLSWQHYRGPRSGTFCSFD